MKSGPGHRLGQAVARQKHLVRHPARRHHLSLQQRQHDMAAAEDQRARSIESLEQRNALGRPRRTARAAQKQRGEQRERHGAGRAVKPENADGPATLRLAAAEARPARRRGRSPRFARTTPGNDDDDGDGGQRDRARVRSGVSVRVMPQTACATTATATSFSPCRKPSASGPVNAAAPSAKASSDQGRGQGEAQPRRQPAEKAVAAQNARAKSRPGSRPDRAGTGKARQDRRSPPRRSIAAAPPTPAENSRDARSGRRTR